MALHGILTSLAACGFYLPGARPDQRQNKLTPIPTNCSLNLPCVSATRGRGGTAGAQQRHFPPAAVAITTEAEPGNRVHRSHMTVIDCGMNDYNISSSGERIIEGARNLVPLGNKCCKKLRAMAGMCKSYFCTNCRKKTFINSLTH